MTHPRLEPIVEFDDMGMLHALQHLKLVIHHGLVAFDVFLEDDLDGDLALWAGRFAHDAIGPRTQCLAKPIPRSMGLYQHRHMSFVKREVAIVLSVIALGLALQLVEHVGHWRSHG